MNISYSYIEFDASCYYAYYYSDFYKYKKLDLCLLLTKWFLLSKRRKVQNILWIAARIFMRYVFIATNFSPDFLPVIQKSTSPTDDVLFLDFYTAQQKKFEKVQNIKIEHVDIRKYNHILYEEKCMNHFFSEPNKRVSIPKPYFPHALRCRLSTFPFHIK